MSIAAFETEDAARSSISSRASKRSSVVASFVILPETFETEQSAKQAPSRERARTLETKGATLNMVTVLVGAGIVALPKAVGSSGWLGGFGLVFFTGALGTTMAWTMCQSCILAEKQGHAINSYDDLGAAAWGPFARPLTMIAVNVTYFGVCCILILLLGIHVSLVVDGARGVEEPAPREAYSFPLGHHNFGGWMVVCTVMLIPLSWLQDMSAIARFSWIGVVGAFGVCGMAMIGSIAYICENGAITEADKRRVMPPSIEVFLGTLNILVFAFGGVGVIPTMRKEMIDPSQTGVATCRGMIITTVLYFLISLPAVLAFGIPGDSVVELMDGNAFVLVAKYAAIACIIANLVLTYPILFNVFVSTLGRFVPALVQPGAMALILRTALVLITFAIAFFMKSLGQMISIVSAVTLAGTLIYLNVGYYFALMIKETGSFGAGIRSIGYVKVVWYVMILAAGLCATIVGLKSALAPAQAQVTTTTITTTEMSTTNNLIMSL